MMTIAMHGARPYRINPVRSSGSVMKRLASRSMKNGATTKLKRGRRRADGARGRPRRPRSGGRWSSPGTSSGRARRYPQADRVGDRGSKVPAAIALIASIGGVRAKSEIESTSPGRSRSPCSRRRRSAGAGSPRGGRAASWWSRVAALLQVGHATQPTASSRLKVKCRRSDQAARPARSAGPAAGR